MTLIVCFIPGYSGHGLGLAYSETSQVFLCWTGGDWANRTQSAFMIFHSIITITKIMLKIRKKWCYLRSEETIAYKVISLIWINEKLDVFNWVSVLEVVAYIGSLGCWGYTNGIQLSFFSNWHIDLAAWTVWVLFRNNKTEVKVLILVGEKVMPWCYLHMHHCYSLTISLSYQMCCKYRTWILEKINIQINQQNYVWLGHITSFANWNNNEHSIS